MTKKNKGRQQPFSPLSYLKSGKARRLPFGQCLVIEGWEELKKFTVIVSRVHASGNITFASFLVDLMCTGVKDALVEVNAPKGDFSYFLSQFEDTSLELKPIDYSLAHNIIWAAEAYAADYGIAPHSEFKWASLILEEDTDDIPMIDIPMGLDGKPLLILHPDDPRNGYYKRQLESHATPGEYFIEDGEDYELDIVDQPSEMTNSEIDWEEYLSEVSLQALKPEDPEVEELYSKCIYQMAQAGKWLELNGSLQKLEVNISYDPILAVDYPQEQLDVMASVFRRMMDDPSFAMAIKLEKELLRHLSKWPDNRVLKNYLYNVYSLQGNRPKADAVLDQMLEDHPDYLFAKFMKARKLVVDGDFDAVKEVFGGANVLNELAPTRQEFHISEFLAFYSIMGLYYLHIKEYAQAYTNYYMINSMAWGETKPHEDFMNGMRSVMHREVLELIKKYRSGAYKKTDILALLED